MNELLQEVERFFANYCNSDKFIEYCGTEGMEWAQKIRADIANLNSIDEIVGK